MIDMFDFEAMEGDCNCGHPFGAHFDGVFEYQACLYEGCECMKWNNRQEKKDDRQS